MTTAVNVFQFFRHVNQFVPLVPLISYMYLLVLFTCLFIEGKEVCETDTLLLIPSLWDINKSFKKMTFVTASIYLLYKKTPMNFIQVLKVWKVLNLSQLSQKGQIMDTCVSSDYLVYK